jgi:hypothetical protein
VIISWHFRLAYQIKDELELICYCYDQIRLCRTMDFTKETFHFGSHELQYLEVTILQPGRLDCKTVEDGESLYWVMYVQNIISHHTLSSSFFIYFTFTQTPSKRRVGCLDQTPRSDLLNFCFLFSSLLFSLPSVLSLSLSLSKS